MTPFKAPHDRGRTLASVLAGALAVLCAMQLVYLAAANWVLKTQLIQKAIASAEGFHLELDDAYSLWPGHIQLRGLVLRFEDYNVQFELTLASAAADISLSELLFKKIHFTKLNAEGTRFRMRHKLIVVGDDAERVAAYPPIRGFADPPYYRGVRPPPVADEDYDLWQLRVENVTARVSELWVLEHRFLGDGLARGSFVVKPARWVQVEPARLELTRGTLRLGQHVVAERVHGHITVSIPDMHVQASTGRGVLKEISAGVELTLERGKLEFLQAYLARLGSARYAGNAEWLLDLNVQRGVLQPGSRIGLLARPFKLKHAFGDLSGDLMVSLARDPRLSPDRLVLNVNAPLLRAERQDTREPGPHIEALVGSLELNATDLAGVLSLGLARAALRRVEAPSLGWFGSTATQLAGSANGDLSVTRSADGAVSGQTHVEVHEGKLSRAGFAASADLQADASFASVGERFDLGKLKVLASRVALAAGGKRSEPFALSLDGSGLQLLTGSAPSARGQVTVHLSSTEALLPLVMGSAVKDVTSTMLDLESLDARANLELRRGSVQVELIDARSGNLRMRGFLSKRTRDPRGAFLLSSGPINVGVTLRGGETEVSPFVADDWLARSWPRISGLGPEPG